MNLLKLNNLLFSIILIGFNIESKEIDYQGATLRILNKITTEKTNYIIPLSQTLELNNAKIIVYRCLKVENDNREDEIALVSHELESYNDTESFLGWIFKSSQYLNTPINPIYDIKLQNCLEKDPIFLKKIPI
ncbi:MAG: hypothetical protein CMP32_01020 [Rickettsiales bacterium]|nr:hypothetical protein [Rickettsiales bacterium]